MARARWFFVLSLHPVGLKRDTTPYARRMRGDRLPRVVIVGRPNVGKSSLLNMLANRRISIVDPTAGVTRDRVGAEVELAPLEEPDLFDDLPEGAARDAAQAGADRALQLEVIDTGGYGIVDTQSLESDVERQIGAGLAQADVVLFVVDAQSGVVPLDRTVAKVLRESGVGGSGNVMNKPVVVVANKTDSEKYEPDALEASSLGLGPAVPVSANTRRNQKRLNAAVRVAVAAAPERAEGSEAGWNDAGEGGLKIALVGKRNAGKSTLLNALVGHERVIVSEHEGTTRDSVDVRVEMPADFEAGPDAEPLVFTAIDTAGLRRARSLADDIEFYGQHRSLRSVRRADVCLFLLDATLPISQVDHLLSQEILKHQKPTVIVVNKWDLVNGRMTEEQYVEYLDDALKGLTFAPVVFISAKEEDGLREAVGMAFNLHEQAGCRVGTGELNRFFEGVFAKRGPGASKHGKQAKMLYATQVSEYPPTLVCFVNDPELFDHNYEQYLMNRIREELPFSEVPVKLMFRGKQKMTAEERIKAKAD